MIKKMIEEISPYLPLQIEAINWDDTVLHMYGQTCVTGIKWHFSSLSNWRFTENNIMTIGCFDEMSHELVKRLKNGKILAVELQNQMSIDPVFVFDNQCRIEIFSTDTYEPWTFSIDKLGYYAATPGTPQLFDP